MGKTRFFSTFCVLLVAAALVVTSCGDSEEENKTDNSTAPAGTTEKISEGAEKTDEATPAETGAEEKTAEEETGEPEIESPLPGDKLVDLDLPESDLGQEFTESDIEDNRIIVNINGQCEFIANGRNYGPVDDATRTIRGYLARESRNHGKEAGGVSKLSLLIRADYMVPFTCIQKVMQISGEMGILIYKIELSCTIAQAGKEGKLNTYLPKESEMDMEELIELDEEPEIVKLEDLPTKIDIVIFYREEDELGFRISVNDKKFGGPDMIPDFFKTLNELHKKVPDLKVTIFPGKGTEYGDVVKVVDECLRAGLTQITFGGVPLDE